MIAILMVFRKIAILYTLSLASQAFCNRSLLREPLAFTRAARLPRDVPEKAKGMSVSDLCGIHLAAELLQQ
jgi:hypothetical protein